MDEYLKLHVGCGAQKKPGYINIDQFNSCADLKIPIHEISFPDKSVELIEGYMVIEHLDYRGAVDFIKNAYRMLIVGGRLILEMPDILKVCKLILASKDDAGFLENSPFGLRGLFGEQKDEMTVGDYHKWGYTPTTARNLLAIAGFKEICVTDGNSHGYPIRDMRVEGVK